MIVVVFPEYKHSFITCGKIGTSSIVSLPSPMVQYKSIYHYEQNIDKCLDHKNVLMLRNPKERFRSGMFTTLFFNRGKISKSEVEWKQIIADYLDNSDMFKNNPTSWEDYHMMPCLFKCEDFLNKYSCTPVHISQLSKYLLDNNIPDQHQNNTDYFDNKVHFYNAFDKVIENYKTQYDSLFEKDMEMYYKWLVGEYVC